MFLTRRHKSRLRPFNSSTNDLPTSIFTAKSILSLKSRTLSSMLKLKLTFYVIILMQSNTLSPLYKRLTDKHFKLFYFEFDFSLEMCIFSLKKIFS